MPSGFGEREGGAALLSGVAVPAAWGGRGSPLLQCGWLLEESAADSAFKSNPCLGLQMPRPAWPASHFALKWPAAKGIRVRGPEQLHTLSSPGG